MKTVIITGSAGGFGLAMLKEFRKNNFNCIICDINEEKIIKAKEKLEKINSKGNIQTFKVDVTNTNDLTKLLENVKEIDIWINNAGVNQPDEYIWNIDDKTIDRLIDINLKGDILASKYIYKYMKKQGYGAIYFTEGFGYDGKAREKLSLYGTSKRAVNFFIDSLAKETIKDQSNIIIGHIIPGIMITDFIHNSVQGNIDIPEKTKLVYNVLGDKPETIAKYIVPKVINNKKQNAKFIWLTNRKAFIRAFKGFALGIHPDYFKENKN